jgi:predicted nuclease with TOPRIM domain
MATESRESFRGSNAANATKITELQELLEKKEAQVSELTQRVADTTEIQQQVLEKEAEVNRLYARLIELQADAANAERAADAAKHQHTNNQPTNNDNMAETTGSVCGCVGV